VSSGPLGDRMFDFLLAAAALVIGPIWIVRRILRARHIVRAWAEAGGYRIEKFLLTVHSISPFPLSAFTRQTVRRVLLRDETGQGRVAWLLLGDSVVGLLDHSVHEVSWEK
jgi:hypothetical protein